MLESDEKRELGGLARSIDALFSEGRKDTTAEEARSAPSVEPPEPVTDGLVTGEALVEMGLEPDPFEALESVGMSTGGERVEEPGDVPPDSRDIGFPGELHSEYGVRGEPSSGAAEQAPGDPSPSPAVAPDIESTSHAETDMEPVAADSPAHPVDGGDGEGGALDTDPDAHVEEEVADTATPEASAPDEPSETPDPSEPASDPLVGHEEPQEPAGSDLGDAVDAFLSGDPESAEEVERISATLRERLALDPLADAVERLVLAGEGAPGVNGLQMAKEVVNPAVASRLVQRMALDEDDERRGTYLLIAERLGSVMANAFRGALTDASDARTRQTCRDGLMGMGDEGRAVVEAMIEDENSFLAQSGVAILGEMGGEGALELVISALANPDFRVRREALSSLAKLGGEGSGQLVMASLEDADATVRAAAAEAAGKLGIERALRPILALLEDDSLADDEKISVQVQALSGLGHLGDPGAVQAIEKRAVGSIFSRPPTEVRVAAYRALHDIGTPHAREVIEKAKDDKDPVVRTAVRGFDAD